MNAPLILASASPRRRNLLAQIGVVPDKIIATDIDESEHAGELPRICAERLAREKAAAASKKEQGSFILAADTIVACGRRMLPKAEDEKTARECLALLSGRAHRVYTGVALAGPGDEMRTRVVETRVKVKRLTADEVSAYIVSDEWRGKAGGYAIQGMFETYIIAIVGSYSNIVGLPLYETRALLEGVGVL